MSVTWDIFRTIVFKIAQQEEHREGLEHSCIRDGILKKHEVLEPWNAAMIK